MALPALLSQDDLVKFRTRFCERFLQYGECNFGGKCQYSHNMAWRRRSPQKYLYEPRMCESIITYTTDSGRRQSVINCHNGKNCKFAHSREEVLFHPALYKTVMCEDHTCSRYYCPFAHSVDELVPTNESMEYIKRCLSDVMDRDENYQDTQDLNDDEFGCANENEIFLSVDHPTIGGLRMRKASGGMTSSVTSASAAAAAAAAAPMGNRLYLPLPGSSDWNISDLSAWVAIIPSMRIETIVRAHSPAVASELCRAIISRIDTPGSLAASKKPSNNGGLNQYCLAKVVQFDSNTDTCIMTQILNELGAVAKTEHRNLLSIRRLHCGPMPSSSDSMLCLAFEQCTTSLYQAIVDGYRNGNELSVRGLARKLNPHNGTTTTTAIQRISDMVSGLQRLHFMGISHMRLCPTNILIDNEATFKIGDFLGKFGILSIHDPAVITPEYSATVLCWQPSEIISEITKSAVRASPKADVFSLACCIFYALTGQHPYGTFASGDRLAAGGYTPSGPLFVNGGVSEVIENIHSDYISNQHLLYNCPLVLDLCMRCLSHDPGDRLDVTELSRHPLFWDFDVTKNFILALPIGNEIFREFCDYELLWKDIVAADSVVNGGGPIASKYSNTINGILEFLINSWNSALSANVRNFAPPPSVMAPISAVWLKVFDRFPHVLIRAWDGARIAAVIKSDEQVTTGPPRAEAFKRHHLHWMMLRSSAVTSISHSFVREYYHLVNGILGGPQVGKWPTCLIFPDESTGLSDACNSYSASIVASIRSCKKSLPPPPSVGVKYVPSPSIPPQVWPSGSPCVLPQTCLPAAACGTPGMKFLDPMIVKQMAAASAALTAVYENPELVVAISQKSGDNGQINPHSQLVAAATIYASLLADSSSTAGAVTSSSIW